MYSATLLEAQDGRDSAHSFVPFTIQEGLAIYDLGQGDPLLLMPYPHGFTLEPMAEGALAHLLVGLGRRVISFDPPGAYRSTRSARVDLPEMLACAEESLKACQVSGRVDVVGHSMGSLCALALSIEHPQRVRRLVLIGSMSGFPAARRWGLPHKWRWWQDPEYWRYIWWGLCLLMEWGGLATHKRLRKLITEAAYVDKTLIRQVSIHKKDRHRPALVRDRWFRIARSVDYSSRLGQVRVPTLICVGRFDPQTPLACSEALAEGIPDAHLVVFDQSGHLPFVEEPSCFADTVAAFFARTAAVSVQRV